MTMLILLLFGLVGNIISVGWEKFEEFKEGLENLLAICLLILLWMCGWKPPDDGEDQ